MHPDPHLLSLGLLLLGAMLSTVVTVAALVSLAVASPVDVPEARTVKIRGTPRPNLFTRSNGEFNYAALKDDILKTKAKYLKQYTYKNSKRAVGTEALTDDVSGGIDEEYYGPISVGTPAQTLRA